MSSEPRAAVSVLGLGPMGSGLARTLLATAFPVTVWNRTASNAEALVEQGAQRSDDPAGAIAASPITLFSLPSYRITRDLLDTADVEEVVRGKTLVQLSTGSARQARELATWAEERGAAFLAGSVMGYPRALGQPDMAIIFGGSEETFARCHDVVAALAPASRRASDDPGGASTVSAALWNFYYGAYGAFLETAALAHAAGATVPDYAELAVGMQDVVADGIRDSARRLSEETLGGDQATIDAIARDLESGRRAFEASSIDPRFTDAFLAYLSRAQEAGDGDKDPAATFGYITDPR